MKKLSFILIFSIIILIECKSQSEWSGNKLLRIEVEKGVFRSLRLFEEGLLCKTIDSNYCSIVEFFPYSSLNFNNLSHLQTFIINNSLFNKDTTIDNPSIKIYSDNIRWIKIRIINNNRINSIYWVDGNSEELSKCIDYLNELIPEQKRYLFRIRYNEILH